MPARPTIPARPVPVGANGVNVGVQHGWSTERAKEFSTLVRWALTERSRAICRGWSKVDDATVQRLMIPLQRFVQHYPVPRAETMRAFWHEHQVTVRAVMPYTAAGRAKLERLAALIDTL